MKKAIILILFIVLVLISIFRCEQPDLVLTPQSVDPNEHGLSLGKKPVNQPTIIELFGIYDNQSGEPVYLIENNEVIIDGGQLLDFTNGGNYRILYRITNPTDIWYIRVLLVYDENTDNEMEFGPHETPVWMLRDEREGENDVLLEGEIPVWGGEVLVHSWDTGLYPPDDEYTLFDQLASFDESGTHINPDSEGKADHYICYIWIVSNAPLIEVKTDFWIKTAIPPIVTYHVKNIETWGEYISKNQVKSYATVNVVADDGSNLGNAIVYGKWSGLGSSIFLKATTNNQGIASFNGPELRNNLSGDEIFTVYAVRFPWSAYNPDENVIENPLWYWPYYRANGSYSMPLP